MALTKGRQLRNLTGGRDDFAPQKGNTIVYAGGGVMLDSSGRAVPAATATGCIGVGAALTNRDLDRYDATGLGDGAFNVRWDEGIFPYKNGGGGDAFASSDQPGLPVYYIDDEQIAKTSGGGTRSPAGRFHHIDSDGVVWVEQSKVIGAQLLEQVTDEGGLKSGVTFTQTYATADTTVPAPTAATLTENAGAIGGTNDGDLPNLTATAATLTDNGGGAAADSTIGAITAPAAITDNSGGVDPGNNTIAVITGPDLSAWNGATDPSAAQATAIGAAFTAAKAAVAQLAAKQNVDRTAIIAATDAVKELSTGINALVADNVALRAAIREDAAAINKLTADSLQNRKLINKLIDALQVTGIAS